MSGTRRTPGRLGPHVDGYRAHLLELGYTQGTVTHKLNELGHLGRWMASEGVDVQRLDSEVIAAFLAATGLRRPRSLVTERTFRPLLAYLRSKDIIAPECPGQSAAALDGLIVDYRRWLFGRALAPATVHRYEKLAQRFLAGRISPEGELDVMNLTGADVASFLLAESVRLSLGSTKGRVGELRSLLRFLHVRGLTARAVAEAVPSVAGWRDTGLPETMTRADVERLLSTCERSSLVGIRDHAILMLLAGLGLRSIEIARLELCDLHWRAGELTVRGKARRCDRLPLPHAVGEALVSYLQRCDRNEERHVFLTLRAPVRPIPPDLVGDVVRRACRRAGLPVVRGHRLRHALACELLRQGASLIDISQVLRHSDLGTTAVYAKVDLVRLRQVAQRWPGAER